LRRRLVGFPKSILSFSGNPVSNNPLPPDTAVIEDVQRYGIKGRDEHCSSRPLIENETLRGAWSRYAFRDSLRSQGYLTSGATQGDMMLYGVQIREALSK